MPIRAQLLLQLLIQSYQNPLLRSLSQGRTQPSRLNTTVTTIEGDFVDEALGAEALESEMATKAVQFGAADVRYECRASKDCRVVHNLSHHVAFRVDVSRDSYRIFFSGRGTGLLQGLPEVRAMYETSLAGEC